MKQPIKWTSILALGASLAAVGGAQAASFKVRYGASIMGLPVGQLDVSSAIHGSSYEIQATGKLVGLVGLFASGKGGAVANGSLRSIIGQKNTLNPVANSIFQASVRLGKSQKVVRIDTRNGNVTTLSMEPPMDDKPGRVQLLTQHKRAVLDPLSATLMPMRGNELSEKDCNRTIPVFDGGSRLDIVMSYAGMRQADIGGYKGQVLVCNVRYVPLAGHRPARRIIRYMMHNKDMSVWLAPIQGTGYMLPLRVSVRTAAGMATLQAEQWNVTSE
ncbi:DUF3108 domain-containing protein [Microvirga sp. W0021]|uniref:DUF3108 domain-containing protein n=1 Tax=Hohaiivirga grylli TaxID=3133970 RepID=A0ABV0BN13_9HYPH